MNRILPSCAAATVLALAPALPVAHAQQSPPAPKLHQEQPPEELPDEDVTRWVLSFGGVLTTGNTETLQISLGTEFDLVRGDHALEAEGTFVLGRAGDNFATETAENLRARARYGYFFSRDDAAFLAARFRQDRFAGLAPRVQGQAGYMRNIFKKKEGKHRFWFEVGYDLTFERFDYELLTLPAGTDPATLPEQQLIHSARLFVGYDNHVDEDLTYKMGIEGLLNVEAPGDSRVNWVNALRTKIGGGLQAELKFTLQLDTQPVEGAQALDTTTMLNVLYTPVNEREEREAPDGQ